MNDSNRVDRRVDVGRWWVRALGVGGSLLAVAVLTTAPADAQSGRRSRQELVTKLTGKPVKVDEQTRSRRAITQPEAEDLVDRIAALTAPSTPASAPVALPTGGTMLRLSDHGAGHVLVSRPNDDGTSDVRCVTSPDEAVDFLAGELDDAWPVQ